MGPSPVGTDAIDPFPDRWETLRAETLTLLVLRPVEVAEPAGLLLGQRWQRLVGRRVERRHVERVVPGVGADVEGQPAGRQLGRRVLLAPVVALLQVGHGLVV